MDGLPRLFEIGQDERRKLKMALECLLFVADQPLRLRDIKDAVDLEEDDIKKLITELQKDYEERSGLAIVEIAGGYHVKTRPEMADYVSKLKEPKPQRLRRPALETLAIVAYRQPITHPEIHQLRGVDSSSVLSTLIEHELVQVIGTKETAGRPKLYGTTMVFLEKFGLRDLENLPPLKQIASQRSESMEVPVVTEEGPELMQSATLPLVAGKEDEAAS